MTTATLEAPAEQAGATAGTAGTTGTAATAAGSNGAVTRKPLWLGRKIPIILLSGEINSGKSLFPLLIDPDCRDFTHDPTTIVWDQEGSCEPYEGGLNFKWEDTRAAVMEGVHMKVLKAAPNDPRWRKIILENADANNFPSTSLFRAWYMSLLTIPRGKYRVGSVDTFTPIQEGLIEWLKCHPEAFGRTHSQYTNASSMFLWPDVKSILSYILSVDCRLRFETFCITVHLKNLWKGGSSTGQRVAEGLDVLSKLATLHLQLDRTAPAKNKSAPRLPFAIVKKQRFVNFGEDENSDKPILPPRLPEATPSAIRAYIANPPDFDNLKPQERMPDDAMSDDDKLRLTAGTAENNRITAEVELTRVQLMRQAAARQAGGVVSQETAAVAVPTETFADGSQHGRVEHRPINETTASAGPTPITEAQISRLKGLLPQAFGSDNAALAAWMGQKLSEIGVQRVTELDCNQADGLEGDLLAVKAQRELDVLEIRRQEIEKGSAGSGAESKTSPLRADPAVAGKNEINKEVPFDSNETPEIAKPAGITEIQLSIIKAALPLAFSGPEELNAEMPKILAAFCVPKIPALTATAADLFIETLEKRKNKLTGKAGGGESVTTTTGPDAPGSATRPTLEQLQKLTIETGWTPDEQGKWLKERHCSTFRNLSENQAQERLQELVKIQSGFASGQGGVPGN